MASGEISTLPPASADSFPPGHFKEPKRLYCKNGGYFLRINPDGRVDGIREKNDPNSKTPFKKYCKVRLQLQATAVGEVVIKGISTNRFLAMSSEGRLFGTKRATDECYFFERLEANNYNTYRSRKYPNWYVALKRTGQYKSGANTGPGQKAILFLPMSAKS
ncbi:fibroblast growth factor 2 isoform X1 [Silurus meridionalis]|uniref:fibroblast growth factor 2 isoform X1 n=1 Tax=Silurus meridionalis TaxID=175797 RepID=UPI001EEC49AB|nr:fibroblast growth factor 2 isoform X1 [Silurus meridionalis]